MLRAGAIVALAAAALLLAACPAGESPGDEAVGVSIRSLPTSTASPTPEPAATPLPPSPTPSPSPAPTAAPATAEPPSSTPAATTADGGPAGQPTFGLSVELSPVAVKQGDVFVVRLHNAPAEARPVVFFAGLSYAMLVEAQFWWAVIGVAADFPPGQQWVQVSTGADGLPILTLTVAEGAFPEENVELPPETSQLLTDAPAIEAERQLLDSLYAGLTPEQLWFGPFIMPVTGPLGDTFGLRRSFNGGPFSNHTGVDIIAAEGTPVAAANAGRVVYVGALHLRGNTVVIDHGAGVFTGYHHLSQIGVAEGQAVSQGETIGAVGATGLVTAAHLHWELIVRGVRVDPLPWTQGEIGP